VRDLNAFLLVIGAVVAGFMLLLVALNAAGRFSREVERQTLDTLLTLPDRDGILFSKWYASILYARGFAWLLALCWGPTLLAGRLHVLALFAAVLSWFVYAAFVASLGLYFSLLTRSTMRATVMTLLTFGGISLVNLMLAGYVDVAFPDEVQPGVWRGHSFFKKVQQVGTVPPITLGAMSLCWVDSRETLEEYLWPALTGVAWYGLLTGVMWLLLRAQFAPLIVEPTTRHQPQASAKDSVPLTDASG
jgi:hypothetical protein